MFFQGDDRVHQTMRRVAQALSDAGIDYAIIGGMAVNAHRHVRTTGDVDFLISRQGLTAFRQLASEQQFTPVAGRSRRFVDQTTGVTFDLLVEGMFPGTGNPGPVAFPDPLQVAESFEQLQVVNLPTLVELKLAARRYQDFADVVNLIRANGLDASFADRLHPSVRPDYIECVEEKRREDEYEARQDADAT